MKILEQKNIGRWVGWGIDSFTRTTFFISIVNMFMLAATFYTTAFKAYAIQYVPWLTFPIFVSFFVLAIFTGMILAYKFIVPSSVAYANEQTWKHENPVKPILSDILAELKKERRSPRCYHRKYGRSRYSRRRQHW